MAFIILGDREQEWERRPLHQAMTIGRSFDCDLPVRDTLLSRQHCRLEPHGKKWVLIDLKSRNGTRVGETLVTRQILEDGDVVRIGQTRLCFRAGPFVPIKAAIRVAPRARPLDPHEAMAMTMNGVELTPPAADVPVSHFPIPKPIPSEPKAFQNDGVGMLVSKMASGVWDSRLANQALARRPAQYTPWTDLNQASPANEPPENSAAKPARWLVITYLFMAGSVFAASLFAIAWPGM
jgi:predicted component of type VI protein secretion system